MLMANMAHSDSETGLAHSTFIKTLEEHRSTAGLQAL
jgi:hypothetical protein